MLPKLSSILVPNIIPNGTLNKVYATGKELQNYETQSFYRTAGIPAMLLFREPFAPEYK